MAHLQVLTWINVSVLKFLCEKVNYVLGIVLVDNTVFACFVDWVGMKNNSRNAWICPVLLTGVVLGDSIQY